MQPSILKRGNVRRIGSDLRDLILQTNSNDRDNVAGKVVVIHDFYIGAEKDAEPSPGTRASSSSAGKPGAPFAVIAPGGGFAYVGFVHDGFLYAVEISERGFDTFVLTYRGGHGGRIATEDLAAAGTDVSTRSIRASVTDSDWCWHERRRMDRDAVLF